MSEQDARNINKEEMAQQHEQEVQSEQESTSDNLSMDNTSTTNKENTALLLGERRRVGEAVSDEAAKADVSRRSRRTFLIAGASALAGYGGWRWLKSSADADGIPAPLRLSHEFNRRLSEGYFSTARLAPEFPRARASEPRVNGGEGMSEGFNPETWRLQVVGVANPAQYQQYRTNIAYETAMDNMNAGDDSSGRHENPAAKSAPGTSTPDRMDTAPAMKMEGEGLLLTLDDIKRLPRVEMTTELKCIEGWSVIVNWAGARFSDFAAQFQPATRSGGAPDARNRPDDLMQYVSLVTPDGGYYVGMDMPSALHPQTLLCYEMNGQPLNAAHGAPLRLVTPVKYGIKHIKRIGRISFTDTRPADFWAERGYDWYSGH